MRRSALVAGVGVGAVAVLAAGCPYVAPGEIRVVEGSTELGPGDQVAFALYCDYLFDGTELASGGPECKNGGWSVLDPECETFCQVPNGSPRLGFIDDCGVYTAPPSRPPEPIEIEGSECGPDCADACSASIELTFIYP